MAQGPPIPAYIFRGHESPIHALHFFSANTYLASGDSQGWLIIWKISTRRPVAAWKGHEGSIMGMKDWQDERLISHGRDHKLRIWQLRSQDFEGLNSRLPADSVAQGENKQPWLIHSMDMNALNFCAFTTCFENDKPGDQGNDTFKPLLLAAPNGLDHGQIDIFQLPSEQRVSKVSPNKSKDSPMVMAVSLFVNPNNGRLTLVSGHEDGAVIVLSRKSPIESPGWVWESLATCKAHSQPVLAVDTVPDLKSFITSSADSKIVKFCVPMDVTNELEIEKCNDTKHAGQQDLKIRSDGRICATAGWDKRIRVYSAKTLKELAVLKWHQEGCYAIAFAVIDLVVSENDQTDQIVPANNALEKFQQKRNREAQNTHWLAAGAKDGKISLWNIY